MHILSFIVIDLRYICYSDPALYNYECSTKDLSLGVNLIFKGVNIDNTTHKK